MSQSKLSTWASYIGLIVRLLVSKKEVTTPHARTSSTPSSSPTLTNGCWSWGSANSPARAQTQYGRATREPTSFYSESMAPDQSLSDRTAAGVVGLLRRGCWAAVPIGTIESLTIDGDSLKGTMRFAGLLTDVSGKRTAPPL